MDTEKLSQNDLAQICGGILTSEDMEWLMNAMRLAKKQGATMEQFLEEGGKEPQSIEFCKFMWDRI